MTTTDGTSTWVTRFNELVDHIAPRFGRKDLRARAECYLRGLLDRVERKNSWQLAEAVGNATPHGIQRLLGRASWSADQVRRDLQNYVVKQLGEPDGVLIVDETGFLKKGEKSVGVARQYSGTAGRIENSQIGVFLAYRSSRGTAFLDRALYLPKEWAGDKDRRHEAGIPDDTVFATKPELARSMIRRALDGGVPVRWVTADEVYGGDSKFRRMLESAGLNYVVAVSSAQRLWVNLKQVQVKVIAAELSAKSWKRLSCGAGSKGQRIYDWAFIAFPFRSQDRKYKGLMIRRSVSDPSEYAYYLCDFHKETPLEILIMVAGCRWSIEIGFEQAKQEVGLDDYEVRSWDGWHRHITLALLAHAFLEVLRIEANEQPPQKSDDDSPTSFR